MVFEVQKETLIELAVTPAAGHEMALYWLLRTSVQKTRHLHQPDFPLLALSSVNDTENRGMENGSLVFLM